jgi:hypothetical protein
VARSIKGVGVQWAGKNALAAIPQQFPGLPIIRVGNCPVEDHRRLSFIAFGGPQANAGLSPGRAS